MTWERWIAPRSTDDLVARQEQLVNILALGSIAAGLFYGLVLLVLTLLPGREDMSPISFIGAGLCLVLAASSFYLSRRGRVRAAAFLITAGAVLIGVYATFMRGGSTVAAIAFIPGVVFAGIVLGGRPGISTMLVCLALYVGITLAQDQGWLEVQIDNSPLSAIALTAAIFLIVALVTWQALRSMQEYIQRLKERESVLEGMTAEKDRLLAELQQREEARYHLLETVRELGSPVIPLAEGVIAMPLIGAIDSGRAARLTQVLLRGVAEHRARAVLVDITAVPVVDAAVAGALIRAMTGVRLLGAEPVLTGIRAEVAQTIVGLGLDLSGMMTLGSFQEGLSYVMGRE